ncbi:uncharacterized protein LOC142627686 isoform X1 [Castanea sativa]|uniref:uncharacterized protein LOC142627686 isoform X1 n=1 Tax=Castanea sativa TaxID=21020 RepID=UPI003F64C6E4
MECFRLCSSTSTPPTLPFHKTVININGHNFPSNLKNPKLFCPSLSTPKYTVNCNCRERTKGEAPLSSTSAYAMLGVEPDCSAAELKAAFRAKVKQFHPDVNRDLADSDSMIRRVIEAYEILSNYSRSEIIERECIDPFEKPECEAFDVFVNEVLCVGKGCPYSCVKRAPHAFSYASTGSARVSSQESSDSIHHWDKTLSWMAFSSYIFTCSCLCYVHSHNITSLELWHSRLGHASLYWVQTLVSKGHGEDYQVQLAVGQCPRSCIHYVTPSQRIILEELLDSILSMPYNSSAEVELLYSLLVKAKFENNRYQKPKKQPKTSTQHIDWF